MQPRPGGLETVATFHPNFTHMFFGIHETVYGYKDLAIHLRYRASDMRPNLTVSWSKKLAAAAAGDVNVDILDIRAMLQKDEHLPKSE